MTARRDAKIFVEDIRDQTEVCSQFLVTRKDVSLTRTGKTYLRLGLADKTGVMEARVWERAEELAATFEVDDFVEARGLAQLYQGQIQISVQEVRRLEVAEVSLGDYLPESRWTGGDLFEQLHVLVSSQVRSEHIQALLLGVFEEPEIAERLRVAPAAKVNHHAYLGGLVEHILSMCRLALRVCDHYQLYYPGLINRDLVIAGCILHDLAKITELSYERSFSYSDAGKLLGHLVMGVELVTRLVQRIEGFPRDLELQLKHLVVSHHERLEYGSPKVPQTVEAILLHYIDNIDAKLNQLHGIVNTHRAGHAGDADWTEKQWSLGRALYLGPEAPEWAAPAPEPQTLVGPGQQLELFEDYDDPIGEDDEPSVVEVLDFDQARRARAAEARAAEVMRAEAEYAAIHEELSGGATEDATEDATTEQAAALDAPATAASPVKGRNLDLFNFPLISREAGER